jgi:hypothetical protein
VRGGDQSGRFRDGLRQAGFVENKLGLGKGVPQVALQPGAIVPDEEGGHATHAFGDGDDAESGVAETDA